MGDFSGFFFAHFACVKTIFESSAGRFFSVDFFFQQKSKSRTFLQIRHPWDFQQRTSKKQQTQGSYFEGGLDEHIIQHAGIRTLPQKRIFSVLQPRRHQPAAAKQVHRAFSNLGTALCSPHRLGIWLPPGSPVIV